MSREAFANCQHVAMIVHCTLRNTARPGRECNQRDIIRGSHYIRKLRGFSARKMFERVETIVSEISDLRQHGATRSGCLEFHGETPVTQCVAGPRFLDHMDKFP